METLGNNETHNHRWQRNHFGQLLQWCINTLRPRQNGRHFVHDIFKCIFVNENVWILHKVSLKCVPYVRIDNIPALNRIMACHRPGDKPSSEPMMVSLLTHICVTRSQWVKAIQSLYSLFLYVLPLGYHHLHMQPNTNTTTLGKSGIRLQYQLFRFFIHLFSRSRYDYKAMCLPLVIHGCVIWLLWFQTFLCNGLYGNILLWYIFIHGYYHAFTSMMKNSYRLFGASPGILYKITSFVW